MSSKPEPNLILSGLSLFAGLGGLVANNGLGALITSISPQYGHLVVSVFTGVSMIAAAVYAQLSTPVTVPKANTLAAESTAAQAKVEAVEAVSKAIASIPAVPLKVKVPVMDQSLPFINLQKVNL